MNELQQAELALEQNNFPAAEVIFTRLLDRSNIECAHAHTGLARVCFSNNDHETAQVHLLAAVRAGGRAKEFSICDNAITICKQRAPMKVCIVLEEILRVFPQHPKPYVELMGYYGNAAQRKLLSKMTEHEHLRDMANVLAQEYFSKSKKNLEGEKLISAVTDEWMWNFECTGWIKTQPPYRFTLLLTTYLAPNTLSANYRIDPISITQYRDKYLFEMSDISIERTRYSAIDIPHTVGKAIEDYVDEAVNTYYNKLLLRTNENDIIAYLKENNDFDSKKFELFCKQQKPN